jgi:hypothetical protein
MVGSKEIYKKKNYERASLVEQWAGGVGRRTASEG